MRIPLLCAVLLSVLAAPLRAMAAPPTAEPTRREAEAVLSDKDNVRAAKQADIVFRYAGKLQREGHSAEALKFMERGLQLAPFRMDQQLAAARLLQQAHQTNQARERAELVLVRAEIDELLAGAAAVLGEPSPADPVTEPWPPAGPAIGIVPLGPVDFWLLRRLRQDLAQSLRVPVVILAPITRLPPPARDPRHQMADSWRARIQEFSKDPSVVEQARKRHLDPLDVKRDEDVFLLSRAILGKEERKGGDTNLTARLDAELAGLDRLGPQWQASALLQVLPGDGESAHLPGRVLLGVTSYDLFDGDSRFVFGLGDGQGRRAVLGYRRFAAALYEFAPDQTRLATRTFKQALSSIGFALGVPRCSSPYCARAFPKNLDEHDAKGTDLCVSCRAAFTVELPPR